MVARPLGIESDVVLPLRRNGAVVEDRLDRALRDARLAVDAVVRVDVEHLLPFVEAIAGADRDAVGVLATDAGFGDDKRQVILRRERPEAARLT